MVKVIPIQRKSAVLTPSALACLSNVATINLTSGCAHGCAYCYIRGYRDYPGDDCVGLYANTATKLRDELRRKRKRPRAVYFSPSSDLFQPLPEVLDLAFEVLEVLFDAELGVAFLTKGAIPERHMELLAANAPLVQAQIGLITLDEAVHSQFEPGTAAPAVRLAQAKRLVEAGIATTGRLDPILPAEDRRALLDRLRRVAESHGITVHPCACKNPDIASGTCHIAGRWAGRGTQPVQGGLGSP